MEHVKIQLTEKNYVNLTTYVLDDSKELLNGKRRPAIVICPGGGYLNCSDREAEVIALRYNAMGYHSFVLRYSTSSKGSDEMNAPLDAGFEFPPETAFPAPIVDIAHAMKCISDNANIWLVDTSRIALCGFSAGAHNCAMYAAYWDNDIVTKPLQGIAYEPAVVILGYGVYDYEIMIQETDNPFDNKLRKVSNESYLGTKNPDIDLIQKVSPAGLVTSKYPPAFLQATQEDSLVPVQNTCEMALALAKNNVAFESHIYEKGQHGLSLANQASAGSKMDINPVVAAWISSV